MFMRFAAMFSLALPWQCPVDLPPPSAWIPIAPARDPATFPGPIAPTRPPPPEKATPRVTTSPPAKPPRRAIQLPEEVVVRALDSARPMFIRCFERAKAADPLLDHLKVTIHLDVDIDGVVTGVHTDSDITKLSNCLSAVARRIVFPAPGEQAVVDVPLMY